MFSTLKQRLLLSLYIFIILSIPVGAYLASQYQTIRSQAAEETESKPISSSTPKPVSAKTSLLDSSQKAATSSSITIPTPTPEPSTTTATSFGPTLSLKVKIEGRGDSDQSTRLFVGIAEGTITNPPKFLLSFTVNVPTSGEFNGLSLAGLTAGNTYSALLKGQSQIATASAFVLSPAETKLNSGNSVNMLSGDLNDDNTINSTDLGIIKSALGSNSSAKNWNESADFNKDGVINIIDYAILYRNFGKTGDSGVWSSPIPASSSAQLEDSPSVGSPNSDGYWIWVPNLSN